MAGHEPTEEDTLKITELGTSLALAVLLVGCGDKEETGETDDTGEPDTSFSATAGSYQFLQDSWGLDWCELRTDDEMMEFPADVEIDDAAGSVSITLGDEIWGVSPGTYDCSWDGSSFDCLLEDYTSKSSGMDADVTTRYDLHGYWTAADAIFAEHITTLSCQGADCEDFASVAGIQFPCDSTRNLAGTLQ